MERQQPAQKFVIGLFFFFRYFSFFLFFPF